MMFLYRPVNFVYVPMLSLEFSLNVLYVRLFIPTVSYAFPIVFCDFPMFYCDALTFSDKFPT